MTSEINAENYDRILNSPSFKQFGETDEEFQKRLAQKAEIQDILDQIAEQKQEQAENAAFLKLARRLSR